ncbi:hypothetical protein SCUCBS95973_000539 [Sporothrix curviconia]|uniref:Uncharacterized protein n=1 Tax=Sporothrix curviconia TaxID=1260050 RepID=A0ABP0ARB6_9PEZI
MARTALLETLRDKENEQEEREAEKQRKKQAYEQHEEEQGAPTTFHPFLRLPPRCEAYASIVYLARNGQNLGACVFDDWALWQARPESRATICRIYGRAMRSFCGPYTPVVGPETPFMQPCSCFQPRDNRNDSDRRFQHLLAQMVMDLDRLRYLVRCSSLEMRAFTQHLQVFRESWAEQMQTIVADGNIDHLVAKAGPVMQADWQTHLKLATTDLDRACRILQINISDEDVREWTRANWGLGDARKEDFRWEGVAPAIWRKNN